MIARLGSGEVLARRAARGDTFLARLSGWMFRARPGEDEALLLTPCDSIHTCFMRFPIDILFLDPDGLILARYDRVAPWKYIPRIRGARSAIEFPGGTLHPAAAPGARLSLAPA